MRVITVAGPPSVGKTSVTVKAAAHLRAEGFCIAVVKFDCLSTADDEIYRRAGLPVVTGLAGSVCPDHFFVSNIVIACNGQSGLASTCRLPKAPACVTAARLMCRARWPSVWWIVVGNPHAAKIGPMLKLADVVTVTKGDMCRRPEREVFAYNVRLADLRTRQRAQNVFRRSPGMSAPLLSLPVGEVMRLHPAFAAFINGADDGAAKPDKILGAWIAGLSEEDLGRIGMERTQVFTHLNSLAAEVEAVKRAPPR